MNEHFFNAQTQLEAERETKIANERKVAAIIAELRKERDLTREEAHFLVSMYYAQQQDRIVNYARASKLGDPPTLILMARSAELFEFESKKALDRYSASHPIGRWMRDITGIGPVMAAGLLSFIDISMCNTAARIWNYAGLTPESAPKKGEKLKYNPDLKKLCFLIGESFVKVSGKENAFYGKLYRERKEYERVKNERGDYADQARAKLEKYKIGKDTDAYAWYSKGKLPPAHLHARARRYAVKMFLSHLHAVWFEYHFGKKPPAPYAIGILGHADWIEPPAFTQYHLTGDKKLKPKE